MTQNHDQKIAQAALDNLLAKAPAGPDRKRIDALPEARGIAEHGQDAEAPAWATVWALIDIAETLRAIYAEGIRIERP
ncbi:uncharacterized protein RMCC_1364 [Mycolicibacterium canariasense]|uniref:Uncharacterized protein n=1 Tax=Mycolicibacterium canariasense TaxID=228230 RepID=A0A124E1Q5_MYCCR|nr:hypothetical protein [Mycolicibacterium canariasense]MCV7208814.1 hypothetical protein [Mycolicibacterium canariasense]ORV07121.1 hypothetical protein AWB94_14055 [Mycolicibacterium canariasense]GAS94398.1 uncharacterized protein RMCC_1364 [Mycolicibacterium canariasense]